MIPGTSSQLNASLTYVQGDTWGGIPAIAITISGTPPADDVASAKLQFTSPAQAIEPITLTSAGGDITIVSASGWTFIVPAQEVDLPEGDYIWGFQTTDISGVIQTYLEGTIRVLPEVVHD